MFVLFARVVGLFLVLNCEHKSRFIMSDCQENSILCTLHSKQHKMCTIRYNKVVSTLIFLLCRKNFLQLITVMCVFLFLTATCNHEGNNYFTHCFLLHVWASLTNFRHTVCDSDHFRHV